MRLLEALRTEYSSAIDKDSTISNLNNEIREKDDQIKELEGVIENSTSDDIDYPIELLPIFEHLDRCKITAHELMLLENSIKECCVKNKIGNASKFVG